MQTDPQSYCTKETCTFENFNVSSWNTVMPNIIEIQIENSNIKTFSYNLLNNFPNVENLIAKNCAIQEIDLFGTTNVPRLNQLKKLLLPENGLKQIKSHTFSDAANLTTLDMTANKIETIEANAFHGLTSLVTLRLGENRIKKLGDNILLGMENLKTIHLQGNTLHTINLEAFKSNKALETLDLSNNYINNIKLDSCLITVKNLNISFNKLRDISALNNLKFLEKLNLSYNPDLHIYSTMFDKTADNLSELSLSGINLQALQKGFAIFKPLTHLKHLYIENAALHELNLKRFPRLESMCKLYITDNPLSIINYEKVREKFPSLSKLVISNRGWDCNFLELMIVKLNNLGIAVETNERTKTLYDHQYWEFNGIKCVRSDYTLEINTKQINELNRSVNQYKIMFWILFAVLVTITAMIMKNLCKFNYILRHTPLVSSTSTTDSVLYSNHIEDTYMFQTPNSLHSMEELYSMNSTTNKSSEVSLYDEVFESRTNEMVELPELLQTRLNMSMEHHSRKLNGEYTNVPTYAEPFASTDQPETEYLPFKTTFSKDPSLQEKEPMYCAM
jgi:hypothetical protein